VAEEAAGGMGLLVEERVSTRWGRAGGRAAAAAVADTEDVEPCRVAAPGAAAEGVWCSSRLTSSVSNVIRFTYMTCSVARVWHGVTRSTYVWRLGIRAVCGLLRGGRLPVGWELALATLVRKHGSL